MIRPAKPEDAPAAAPLLILAMGHIALTFAQTDNPDKAAPFFESFFEKEGNQYSYANTLVFEDAGNVIGAITGYDGAKLHALRQPVLDAVRKFDPDFKLGDETEAGEYYIDCLAVDPAHQGKGIAGKLIHALCDRAAALGHVQVGLIVDKINPKAKELYEKAGFEIEGEKDFVGHRYYHMVRQVL